MNRQRVKQLLNSNIETLTRKENPSLNLIELFEITEHIAREMINDSTPIISRVPNVNASPKEISWMHFKDFSHKYKFITNETLHEKCSNDKNFSKFCKRERICGSRLKFHLNEKEALQYFLDIFNQNNKKHPFINKKIAKNLEFIQAEFAKL